MGVLQERLGIFHEEISFLMETLLFVFLGLTFEITGTEIFGNLTIGVEVLLILLLFRGVAATISTRGSELSNDRREIVLMCAQGLVPATLAIISVDLALPLADSFLNIVTYVIILTNVVAAIGAVMRTRSRNQGFRDFMASLDAGYRVETKSGA